MSGARCPAPRDGSATAAPTTALYHDGLVWVAAAPAPQALPAIAGPELRISTPTDTASQTDLSHGAFVEEDLHLVAPSLSQRQ